MRIELRETGRSARTIGDLPLVIAGRDIERYLRSRGFGDAELAGVHFIGFVPNAQNERAL